MSKHVKTKARLGTRNASFSYKQSLRCQAGSSAFIRARTQGDLQPVALQVMLTGWPRDELRPVTPSRCSEASRCSSAPSKRGPSRPQSVSGNGVRGLSAEFPEVLGISHEFSISFDVFGAVFLPRSAAAAEGASLFLHDQSRGAFFGTTSRPDLTLESDSPTSGA